MTLQLIQTDLPNEKARQHRTLIATTVNELAKVHPEQGEWTPRIGGSVADGAHTYSVQSGSYFKIGTRVFADFAILLTAKDAALSGTVTIKGLPFVPLVSGMYSAAIGLFGDIDLTAGKTQLTGLMGTAAELALLECGDGVSPAGLTAAAIGATSHVRGSVNYDIAV